MVASSEYEYLFKRPWFITLTICIIVLLACLIAFFKFRSDTIRQFNYIQTTQHNNTIFYDIDNKPFHIISGEENRKYIPLSDISRNLQMSVVAIEDGRFFHHFGFD